MMNERFYFRQLLAGRDIATDNPLARQMVNFVYLLGDRDKGEAVVVDPAYDVAGIVDVLAADDMTLTGALVTHYHPDHIGGSMMGYDIEGIAELMNLVSVPVHCQTEEASGVAKMTGLAETDLVLHSSADKVMAGDLAIECIHTPGHTPGSQCFLVEGHLVAGDTLFLEGCGRTDLPGGDPAELYHSLHTRLAKVDDNAVLYPGHLYSPEPSQSMGDTRKHNFVFKPNSEEQWMTMFGS